MHHGVDGAVSESDAKYFVAIVNSRHEKYVAEKLENLGYTSYIATKKRATCFEEWKNEK